MGEPREPLSLDPVDGKVYRWVRRNGTVNRRSDPGKLDLTPDQLMRSVSRLQRIHLLRPVGDAEGEETVEAVSPDLALALLANEAESSLLATTAAIQRSRDEIDILRTVYNEFKEQRKTTTRTLHVPDVETVGSLIAEAAARCRNEALTCQPGGGRPAHLLREAIGRDLSAIARGVRMRILYQHTARHHGPTQSYVEKVVAGGAQVRTMAGLPARFIAFDREIAFIPTTDESEGAVVVTDPLIVTYLCQIFDTAWTHAAPYLGLPAAGKEGSVTEGIRGSIVGMLADGMRDDMIARRLGMSLRTCRKHISEIMRQLGAATRFQAGYKIREWQEAESSEFS